MRLRLLIALLALAPMAARAELLPEPFVQLGHSDGVSGVALSPDGAQALSASDDKTIRLWDVATTREVRTLVGHTDFVTAVAFLPDGTRAISTSWDRSVRLWELSTGRELRRLSGHAASVLDVNVAPDGRTAVTASEDGTLRLWELASGRSLRTLKGGAKGVYSAVFSPDGTRLLSGGFDRKVRLWDVATGRLLRTMEGHGSVVTRVAFTPDGLRAVSVADDQRLHLWALDTGAELARFPIEVFPKGLVVTADGASVLVSTDRVIRRFELPAGRALPSLEGHTAWVNDLALSRDGTRVLSGSLDRSMRLWDLASGRTLSTFAGLSRAARSAALSPDGRFAAWACDDELELWDLQAGRRTRVLRSPGAKLASIAWSPDGGRLASTHADSTTRIWDASTGAELRVLEGHATQPRAVLFLADGAQLLTGDLDGTIRRWELATGKQLHTFRSGVNRLQHLALSPDGRWLAAAGDDRTIRSFTLETGAELRRFVGHGEGTSFHTAGDLVTSLAISPDGTRLISSATDRSARVWETATGKQLRRFDGHAELVRSVALLPDGRTVLSGGYDDALRLWDLQTGAERRRFPGPDGALGVGAVLSRDGRRALLLATDGTPRLLELATGRELARFVSFADGAWLTITPEHWFHGSPTGPAHMNVRLGTALLTMDNFFERFSRPDLVQASLAGEAATGAGTTPAPTPPKIEPPPRVALLAARTDGSFRELTAADANDLRIEAGVIALRVVATDAGGGIGGVRLFNGGKGVGEHVRGLRRVEAAERLQQDFTVSLTDGENRLSVVGLSTDGTESNPVVALVRYKPAVARRPNLWIVAVGVNDYRNPRYALRYSVADAQGFLATLVPRAEKLFGRVHTTLLTDREATRGRLLQTLDELQGKVEATDVFLLFYAGHGIALDLPSPGGPSRSEFFYVLTEVTQMTDPARVAADGVSGSELREKLARIRATKQVLFVDACNSGALAAQFAMRGAAEENALAKLGRASGSVIYASTTKEQLAAEFTELKHGAFTFVLLQALEGGASLPSGEITVASIKAYVDDRIPEVTRKFRGEEQFPIVYLWGQDFPLGLR